MHSSLFCPSPAQSHPSHDHSGQEKFTPQSAPVPSQNPSPIQVNKPSWKHTVDNPQRFQMLFNEYWEQQLVYTNREDPLEE